MGRIPLFRNFHDNSEIELISRVIKRGTYWANGPEIEEFEKIISEYIGVKNCISFNSGTSALHSVLEAYDIKGSEVVVPSFTFISTANSVIMAGGRPIFADIEDRTFGLDPEDVKEKISSRTKVVIPVHYGGCPCDISSLLDIAEDHDLILIEDAAESLGSEHDEKKIGSFGDSSMFSFTPAKVVTTGEGGVIVTENDDIARRLRLFRSHGRTNEFAGPELKQQYVQLGYNFRLSSINAALGIAQMSKIDRLIEKRRRIAEEYDTGLKDIDIIRLPYEPKDALHTYQMYSILIENEKMRDQLRVFLKEKGIDTKVNFEPIHKSPFYSRELGYEATLPNTEGISNRIVTLPLFPGMRDGEVRHIIGSIHDFFEN